MTRQHNIEIIRQACIKANPEIMELKPGCFVRDFLKGAGIVMGVEKNAGESDCYDIFCTESDHEVIWQQPRGHLDVLGRPLKLADVLLAMEPIGGTTYAADRLINFYVDLDSNDVRWNLRADDLTQQSDECLTFLVGLLDPDDISHARVQQPR